MTRNTFITSADKALWDRARVAVRHKKKPRRPRDIDPKTANLIAGYLSGTLSGAEQRALSKRLKDRPEQLDVLLAARAAMRESNLSAPQSLRALARHAYPSKPAGGSKRGGGVLPLPRPVVGWIAASLIAVALAVGGFFLGQRTGGIFAENSAGTADQKMADDLELGSEPGLPGSENGLFDALDLDF